jgi:hypothetical protein
MKINYSTQSYTVASQPDFKLSEALSLWKAKYPEFADFKKDVIIHESLEDFGQFVLEMWDEITPVTVQDALNIPNTEIRRTYFDCIGVQQLFKQLEPTLRDRQVIKKKRTKWDDNNDPVEYEFEDVYELYEIEGTKMFELDRWGNKPNSVYAVRCWCTTTNREYWLYVSPEAAMGRTRWLSEEERVYDAIQAIAWTIRLDVTNPEKIYRQGDVIIAKIGKDTLKHERFTHLDKEQYLKLMYSET